MSRYFSKNAAPYFLITAFFITIYVALARLTPFRVGDGAEYYALFYAWSDTFRPWMTADSFNSYELLFSKHAITGLVPLDWLVNAFPSLRVGPTADFNHFWFYSLLAFLVSKFLAIVGIPNGPHQSFLALHFILLLGSFVTVFHFYKWRGLIAMAAMTLASPMLWYFDKVHTELFTYCIVLLAILFVLNKKYLAGALMLAIASTQNPSFALIAFVPFLYRLVILRSNSFSFAEVVLAIGATLAAFAHPLYYFLRFGVPTPQLLAGGASLGGNLSDFYIWLIDPDLGLLTNWPTGVAFILAAMMIVVFADKDNARIGSSFFYFFISVFFFVNFYAHSSTTNLNSGATPGVARYSLWYLPAFFPLVYYVITKYPNNKILRSLSIFVLVSLTILSVVENDPRGNENYSTPTPLSSFIQTHASSLYDPPPEVFAERYSGAGESIHAMNPRAILGPDCKKMLIYPGDERLSVTASAECFVDVYKLQALADSLAVNNRVKDAFYVHINNKMLADIYLSLKPGEYLVGQSKYGSQILSSGWSSPEPWGVWSDGKAAKISFPCNSRQFYFNRSTLQVGLFIHPFASQDITIEHNGTTVYQSSITEGENIRFPVSVEECKKNSIDLVINIPSPKSPLELGQSTDARKLGIGLTKFTLN